MQEALSSVYSGGSGGRSITEGHLVRGRVPGVPPKWACVSSGALPQPPGGKGASSPLCRGFGAQGQWVTYRYHTYGRKGGSEMNFGLLSLCPLHSATVHIYWNCDISLSESSVFKKKLLQMIKVLTFINGGSATRSFFYHLWFLFAYHLFKKSVQLDVVSKILTFLNIC